MGDELIEVEKKQSLSREEAAGVLRQLADSLARHNEIEFVQGGLQMRAEVPDQVELEVDIEITSTGGSLEIEIEW